jgi:hypothetical protein
MDSHKRIALFILLLLLSFGVFRMAGDIGKPGHADFASFDPRSARVENIVNKHLTMTDRKILLQNDRAQLENTELPAVGDQIWPKNTWNRNRSSEPRQDGVDLSSDRREEAAISDLNRNPKEYGNYRSPHSVIQNEESEKDARALEQKWYRERYAQQFIENARRNGIEVKLNDDLVVIDVRKANPIYTKNPVGFGSE